MINGQNQQIFMFLWIPAVLQWYSSKELSEQNLFACMNSDEEKSLREKLL